MGDFPKAKPRSSLSAFPIAAGVPQGSVLGPTLFLLYVNDLEDHILDLGVSLATYDDDTTLYTILRTRADKDSCSADLQRAADALAAWGKDWRITFEPTKSSAMTFTRWRKGRDFEPLHLDGVAVPETDELKLLGLLFDMGLTHGTQIRLLVTNARRRLGFLRRACHYLDPDGCLVVYKAFVRPMLETGHLVWMGAADSHLAKLGAVQAQALTMMGQPRGHWDALVHRRTVGALCYLYKLQCEDIPPRLSSMIPPKLLQPIAWITRGSQSASAAWHPNMFQKLPHTSSDLARRAFPYGVVDDWNALPASLLDEKPSRSRLQFFKCAANAHLRHLTQNLPALC